jgi:hypothetical protein
VAAAGPAIARPVEAAPAMRARPAPAARFACPPRTRPKPGHANLDRVRGSAAVREGRGCAVGRFIREKSRISTVSARASRTAGRRSGRGSPPAPPAQHPRPRAEVPLVPRLPDPAPAHHPQPPPSGRAVSVSRCRDWRSRPSVVWGGPARLTIDGGLGWGEPESLGDAPGCLVLGMYVGGQRLHAVVA